LDPQVVVVQTKNGPGKISRHLALHEAQPHDGGEEHDLPVEEAGGRQVAADEAVNAEIDKWRKRPDVILVGGEGAQLAGDEAAECSEGHRSPFAVHYRWN